MLISIGLGIAFTCFVLNKKNIYAKEEYLVYAFQVGAYEDVDNAASYLEQIPSGIIRYENGLYKVYAAIYKDLDIVNTMVLYFENIDINIYLKTFTVSKDFYKKLDNYERLIKRTNDSNIYDKINQNILSVYLESI